MVDDRHRIALRAEVRRSFPVRKGDRLLVIPAGDELIIRRLPERPEERLSELLRGIEFNRDARRRAERWLMREARGSS